MNKINKLKDLIDEHFFKLEKLKTNNLKKDELHSHLSQHNKVMTPCGNKDCNVLLCNLLHKCKHYKCHDMMKLPELPKLQELPEVPKYKYNYKSAQYEEEVESGGLTNVGVKLQIEYPNARIGTMVAGNSGRPGGSCGEFNGNAAKLHPYHKTQEEDVVSNWLLTTSWHKISNYKKRFTDNILFRHTIHKQWGVTVPKWDEIYGMVVPFWNKQNIDYKKFYNDKDKIFPDEGLVNTKINEWLHWTNIFPNWREDYTNTIQEVDYTNAEPYQYADAWVVRNAYLSEKVINQSDSNNEYNFDKTYLTTLVFVAGPNCGSKGSTINSSMSRTYNTKMKEDYNEFVKGVEATLFAGLYAMAAEGCTIALLAYVSAGIYAGSYQREIQKDFKSIVNKVLKRKCLNKKNNEILELGKYFDKVILTKLR